jgi:hypothetical protein
MSSTAKKQAKLSVGDKGRITLGSFAEGVSSFAVEKLANGNLLLKPLVEIPAQEAWLFRNRKALASVKRGLKDLEAGRLNDAPEDFSQYLDDQE